MAEMISSIYLCSVPITPAHQLDFSSITEQQAYFNSKKVLEYNDCKYTPRTGKIRVSGYVDTFNNVNYGYYINSYKGTSKTFYFWIMERNLVAKNVTELTIQLDVFQTWLFDFTVRPCFVERQHAVNDQIGINTYPENFELGDYIVSDSHTFDMGDVGYFVGVTDSTTGVQGGIYGKQYCGYSLYYYSMSDYGSLSDFINDLCINGKADSIAFIFTYPMGLINGMSLTSGQQINSYSGFNSATLQLSPKLESFSYGGRNYVPFNNKLFTYPYNFIEVSNLSGSNVIWKYELFNDLTTENYGRIQSVLGMNPTIEMYPMNYKGLEMDYDDAISREGYGLCSWNNDNYANWYANHQNSIVAQSINARASYNTSKQISKNNATTGYSNAEDSYNMALLNTGASALSSHSILGALGTGITGYASANTSQNITNRSISNDLNNNFLSATTDYQNTITSLMAQVQDSQVQPNTCKGDTSACGLDLARGTATFQVNYVQIKQEYARKIDYYWQMYGYALNEVTTPNVKGRDKWNYVKTANSNVAGNIPMNDKLAIDSLFNNGLTIWHSEDYMFNYGNINNIK